MELILGINKRYGVGHQIRPSMPPLSATFDARSFTRFGAASAAEFMLSAINSKYGTCLDIREALKIAEWDLSPMVKP